jgi:hypothetical protein
MMIKVRASQAMGEDNGAMIGVCEMRTQEKVSFKTFENTKRVFGSTPPTILPSNYSENNARRRTPDEWHKPFYA